jgi:hypothetical protein
MGLGTVLLWLAGAWAKVLAFLLHPKVLLCIAILGLLVMLCGYSYATGKVHKEEELRPEINRLKTALSISEGNLSAARQTATNQHIAYTAAFKLMEDDYKTMLSGLTLKLDRAEARNRKQLKDFNDRTPLFVTAKADAACTVPAGFVRLHDLSAQGLDPDPASAAEASSVPGSGLKNVDAASGVALSAVTTTIVANYSECTARGEVIDAWQSWYSGALETWKKGVAAQANFQVVLPTAPVPTP